METTCGGYQKRRDCCAATPAATTPDLAGLETAIFGEATSSSNTAAGASSLELE